MTHKVLADVCDHLLMKDHSIIDGIIDSSASLILGDDIRFEEGDIIEHNGNQYIMTILGGHVIALGEGQTNRGYPNARDEQWVINTYKYWKRKGSLNHDNKIKWAKDYCDEIVAVNKI